MQLYSIFEWDSLAKRVAMLGPSSATPEDFDYSAGTQIPELMFQMDSREILLEQKMPLGFRIHVPCMQDAGLCSLESHVSSIPPVFLILPISKNWPRIFMLSKLGYLSVFSLWDRVSAS